MRSVNLSFVESAQWPVSRNSAQGRDPGSKKHDGIVIQIVQIECAIVFHNTVGVFQKLNTRPETIPPLSFHQHDLIFPTDRLIEFNRKSMLKQLSVVNSDASDYVIGYVLLASTVNAS